MIAPPDTFVSIDLETTGLDPQLNEIIEIGAVRIRGGEITAEFSEFVRPSKPVPDFITYLTGITDSDVRNAGTIGEVMPRFLDFVRDDRMVGQNVAFDTAFIRHAAGMGSVERAVDNIELARILLPMLPSYSLDSLIDFFALDPGNRHRALDDARVTALVFLRFIDMIRVLPDSFLHEMHKLASKTGSPAGEIFEAHVLERANEAGASSRKTRFTAPKVLMRSDNVFGDFTKEIPFDPEEGSGGIDTRHVEKLLADGGVMAEVYPEYEERPGQIAMAKAVAQAFKDSEMLLAEAGTGIGKSVAYLIPAVIWAESSRERVVISTNTKNLQEQLFCKDIPLIGKIVDFPFRAVILKGRGNYICLHRWERLISSPNRFLSREERDLILPVASWVQKTATGDLSETGFYSMLAESGLLEHINSDHISCVGSRCPSRDRCFVNRVRRAAQRAHIIVVNHSLIFSDMVSEGGVLGPYGRLVFDEAHNIEKVALQYLGVSFTYYRMRRVLNRLYAKNEGAHGLLAMLRGWADDMSKGWAEFVAHAATFEAALETVQQVRSATRELFEQLNSAVHTEASGKRNILDGKLRYDENTLVFSSCADAIETFTSAISLLIAAIEDIKMIVSGVSSGQLADREETIIELEKSQVDLQTVVNDFEMLVAAGGSNVYWFEYSDNGYSYSLKIQSAPLDIAEKLSVGLYDHMETVVMASATLTVARDFSYISKRLGLDLDSRERVREFIAASPFDYPRQAAVIVPSFLPSPKHETFVEETNDVLYRIATEIGRGMLVLFTSRGHLNRSYHELKDPLTRKGLTLMGQGIDGSRSLLVRRFREDKQSILFGTDSFWEGVDVPGSALEIVVIIKLPFAVPADPVVQAQLEEVERAGGNPFMDYSVPEAAIKLRQGAGRLIRHRGDRGIVVVLDNRIVTTRYGETFKRCLPGTFIKTDSTDNLVKSISAWFGD